MNRRRATLLPIAVLGGSFLLGGYFLQEGVTREENVYVQVRVFQEVMDRISNQYVDEFGEGELYEDAIEGLIDRLGDRNSSFIPASDFEDFEIQATGGEYGGVGLEVSERNGLVTVVNPIPGTPAARVGIRPGDWFVEIDGENAEGISVDEAVAILRGRAGTSVDVEIGRPGMAGSLPFTLRRAEIKLASVPFQTMLEGDVGYVPLQVFREASADEVSAAMEDLRRRGARAVVLDLRGNPGGLLTDGVAISDIFLDRGDPIVEVRGRTSTQSENFVARSDDAYADLEVAILVNDRSASAAEIVAGALQDHDRALVIGTPTYGKGSVQTLFRLTGGNVLRLTTGLWYTPVGRSVERDPEVDRRVVQAALGVDGSLVYSTFDSDRPTFESMAGREIYGGGGVTPDLRVVLDTLATEEARATDELYRAAGQLTTTLFNFAVEYVQSRPDLRIDFTLSEAELGALNDALIEAGVTELGAENLGISEAELLRRAERHIRFRLESEIALQAFGDQGQFERMADQDAQLQAALAQLRYASSTSELLELGP